MTVHPQRHIQYHTQEADVDVGLAPIVLELWKAGISTLLSCQEVTDGVAWLKFASVKDATRFLTIVCDASRGGNITEQPDLPKHERIWSFRVHPRRSVSIRPPRRHLPDILAKLQAYNRRHCFPKDDCEES